MQKTEGVFRWLAIILMAVLAIYVSWYQLGSLTIRMWDESRLANNAIEMYNSGHYWVTTYDNQPDLWNTKPPLMIWLQVLSLRLFGLNDLALRVPSALASIGTYAAVFYFGFKRLNNFWWGFVSMIVLVSTQGYIGFHVGRYAEFDALLILFVTLACSAYFSYLTTESNRSLYSTFIFFGLAVLTKSIVGLMFGPALLLFTLYCKKGLTLLRNKHTYIGLAIFIVLACGYYIIREQLNPGYWAAVMKNDLGGRFLEVIEAHLYPWNWYIDLITGEQAQYWYIVALVAPVCIFFEKNTLYRKGAIYVLLLAVSFLLIISSARTKLMWYPAPIYPFMALAAGYSIVSVLGYILRLKMPEMAKAGCVLVVGFILAGIARKEIIAVLNKEEWHGEHNDVNYFLRDDYIANESTYPLCVVYDEYYANTDWYLAVAKARSLNVKRMDKNKLTAEDIVLCQGKEILTYLEQHYVLEVKRNLVTAYLLRIVSRRN